MAGDPTDATVGGGKDGAADGNEVGDGSALRFRRLVSVGDVCLGYADPGTDSVGGGE